MIGWNTDLQHISLTTKSTKYIAFGDFNVTLCPEEVSVANPGWTSDIKDFNATVNKCCLVDLRYSGEYFTWTNRRYGRADFTQRKLDRALVNQYWIDNLSESFANFKPQVFLTILLLLFILLNFLSVKAGLLNSIIIGLSSTIILTL